MHRVLRLLLAAMLLFGVSLPAGMTSTVVADSYTRPLCQQNSPLCTEVLDSLNINGQYTGHDEPSVLFYSNKAGSGNSNLYQLTLPKDPPTLPKQDGTGGTFNFQLHPAFWFGMALCDSQSAPNPGMPCLANTDANIFDNADPNAADYIGKHPGVAFMEMQFYPPGWVSWPPGVSCDPTKWCAALTIDSFSENQNTGVFNNAACLNSVGPEPVNFAFITKNGQAQAPANPVAISQDPNFTAWTPDAQKDLFMNSGDNLSVQLHDTPQGFEVVIRDLSTGESGSMKASVANGFGQVQFDPNGTTCNNIPYAFHPAYSTSSEHTRVPWAAHSYNVAFSDEIGHFEYCNADDGNGGCAQAGVNDPGGTDSDDYGCFGAGDSLRIQVGGCIGTENDFDGPDYQNTWPGSLSNPGDNRRLNPTSILFSSPLFHSGGDDQGNLQNYERVAFESDMPRIERPTDSPNNNCNFHTGAGCVNPPNGASFYPIFTTRPQDDSGCVWQLGGPNIPGTKDTFGGNSTAEYGPLLQLAYPGVGGPSFRYNNFRQILPNNPCKNSGGDH